MQLTWKRVPIGSLKQHPENPRKGDVAKITESAVANGFYGCVVVQQSTGFILAGNHAWQVAKREKLKRIDAAFVDVDDATALRILLADNRTADLGQYDKAELVALLSEVGTLTGTGYDREALQALIAEVRGKQPKQEGGDAGDGAPEDDQGEEREEWHLVVSCRDDKHQAELLKDLSGRGYQCRANLS